jgi:hypothetical protein
VVVCQAQTGLAGEQVVSAIGTRVEISSWSFAVETGQVNFSVKTSCLATRLLRAVAIRALRK